jgi:hypothetical protein
MRTTKTRIEWCFCLFDFVGCSYSYQLPYQRLFGGSRVIDQSNRITPSAGKHTGCLRGAPFNDQTKNGSNRIDCRRGRAFRNSGHSPIGTFWL